MSDFKKEMQDLLLFFLGSDFKKEMQDLLLFFLGSDFKKEISNLLKQNIYQREKILYQWIHIFFLGQGEKNLLYQWIHDIFFWVKQKNNFWNSQKWI